MADTKISALTSQATLASAFMSGVDGTPTNKKFPGYAFWGEKGADVASTGTLVLGDDGNFFHITGTTTITDIDFTTAKDGRMAVLEFDGALILTHNATTLQLPGGANITTEAGDRAIVVQDSGDNVHVINYIRKAVQPPYITPWVAYTPTFTNLGTVSSIFAISRRVGDTLQVRAKFTLPGSGGAASEARMSLGFNGTNANVTSDSTKVPAIQVAGDVITTSNVAGTFYVTVDSNVGYVNFTEQSSTTNGLTKLNGNGFGAQTMSIMAEIPISGW